MVFCILEQIHILWQSINNITYVLTNKRLQLWINGPKLNKTIFVHGTGLYCFETILIFLRRRITYKHDLGIIFEQLKTNKQKKDIIIKMIQKYSQGYLQYNIIS